MFGTVNSDIKGHLELAVLWGKEQTLTEVSAFDGAVVERDA